MLQSRVDLRDIGALALRIRSSFSTGVQHVFGHELRLSKVGYIMGVEMLMRSSSSDGICCTKLYCIPMNVGTIQSQDEDCSKLPSKGTDSCAR